MSKMSYKDDFDIFVGGTSGIIKGVKIENKINIIKNLQDLVSITENDGVTAISWGDDDEKDVLIACGIKKDRRIKIYDSEASTFTCSFLCNKGKGSINGISRYNGSILTAVKSGEISLWRFDKEEAVIINAGENLNKMSHSRIQRNIIATGGQENRLKLYDLEKQALIFSEKNLSHDWLELRVPICISDINFLPGTQQVVTTSRYGNVCLYDPRTQRRPVINIKMQDEALSCLCVTPKEKHIIVGSGKGKLNLVDLRKSGTLLNTYKGSVGGVTAVTCSTSSPCIASVGMDRYLRIHHMDTKELLQSIYLTSKLTCMLMRLNFSMEKKIENNQEAEESRCDGSNNKHSSKNDENDEASEEEYDELFNKMQVVGNKDKKSEKKRKLKATQENLNDRDDVPKNSMQKIKKKIKHGFTKS